MTGCCLFVFIDRVDASSGTPGAVEPQCLSTQRPLLKMNCLVVVFVSWKCQPHLQLILPSSWNRYGSNWRITLDFCHMSTGWRFEAVPEAHAGKEQLNLKRTLALCGRLAASCCCGAPPLTETTPSRCAGPVCAGSSSENPGCLALQSGSHVEGLWVPPNTLADNPQQGVSPSHAAKRGQSREPQPPQPHTDTVSGQRSQHFH